MLVENLTSSLNMIYESRRLSSLEWLDEPAIQLEISFRGKHEDIVSKVERVRRGHVQRKERPSYHSSSSSLPRLTLSDPSHIA
jgi:hypothetical protein